MVWSGFQNSRINQVSVIASAGSGAVVGSLAGGWVASGACVATGVCVAGA